MRSNLLRRLIQVLIILPFPSWEMLREKPLMYIRMTFSIGVDLKIGSFFMFSLFFYGDTVDVVGCIGKREQGNKHKYILCSRQQSYHGSRLCIHALIFYFFFLMIHCCLHMSLGSNKIAAFPAKASPT